MRTWTTREIVIQLCKSIADYDFRAQKQNKPAMRNNSKTLRYEAIRFIEHDDYLRPNERYELMEMVQPHKKGEESE